MKTKLVCWVYGVVQATQFRFHRMTCSPTLYTAIAGSAKPAGGAFGSPPPPKNFEILTPI